jgi:hypothetical protein
MPTHATDDILLLGVNEGNGAKRAQTPSGWTELVASNAGNDYETIYWKKAASASETVTVSFTSHSDTSAWCMSIQDANGTTPFPNVSAVDVTSGHTDPNPTAQSCSVGDAGIHVSWGDRNANGTYNPGAGTTYTSDTANKSTALEVDIHVTESESSTTITDQTWQPGFGDNAGVCFNCQP